MDPTVLRAGVDDQSGGSAVARSARTARDGNAQLLADRPGEPVVDLAMTWHGGAARAVGRAPLAVVGAFVDQLAAVLAQVFLKVAALHAAIVSCSGSLVSPGPSEVGSGLSMRRSASMTFARASSRVCPWLIAPGTSGMLAMIQPSSPGS